MVDEAHYWKLRVTAHVGGAQDLHQVSGRLAVEAGVDSVEHLYPYGGAEVVKELARKGIYVIPTMGYHLRELAGEYTYKADWLEANLGHTRDGMMELFRQMRESGVKFGVGTDSNAKDLDTIGALYLQELQGLSTGGLTPMQVIQSATLHAAEAMGLGAEAGSIASGKRADVILVRQDPLADIGALVRPGLVIQNGEIVHRSDALEGSWTLDGYEREGKEIPVSGTMIFEDGHFGLVYRMGPGAGLRPRTWRPIPGRSRPNRLRDSLLVGIRGGEAERHPESGRSRRPVRDPGRSPRHPLRQRLGPAPQTSPRRTGGAGRRRVADDVLPEPGEDRRGRRTRSLRGRPVRARLQHEERSGHTRWPDSRRIVHHRGGLARARSSRFDPLRRRKGIRRGGRLAPRDEVPPGRRPSYARARRRRDDDVRQRQAAKRGFDRSFARSR